MGHLVEKDALLRVNAAMVQGLIGGGLIVTAVGSVVFDLGRAVGWW